MNNRRGYSLKANVGKPWFKALTLINGKLVRGKVRVHRGRLYYQSSAFPPKGDSGRPGYQNRYDYALRLDAEALVQKDVAAGVLALVLDIDRELLWGRWQWPVVAEVTEAARTVADYVASFEAAYWEKRKRTENRKFGYDRQYGHAYRRLPSDAPLTTQLLLDVVKKLEPSSRQRMVVSQCYGALAEHAGLDSTAIREAGKGWTLSDVKLRDLPTDAEGWATYESLAPWPEYQSGFLLLLLYGIRPHEMLYCQSVAGDTAAPHIHVAGGKTGERDAYALPSKDWPEVQWDGVIPPVNPRRRDGADRSHIEIGSALARQYKARGVPGPLYNYRHMYAVRGFAQGKKVGMMARSMGHAEAVHCRTYQSAVSKKQFEEGW